MIRVSLEVPDSNHPYSFETFDFLVDNSSSDPSHNQVVVLVVGAAMTYCCILVAEFESFSPINRHNKLIIKTSSLHNPYLIIIFLY